MIILILFELKYSTDKESLLYRFKYVTRYKNMFYCTLFIFDISFVNTIFVDHFCIEICVHPFLGCDSEAKAMCLMALH